MENSLKIDIISDKDIYLILTESRRVGARSSRKHMPAKINRVITLKKKERT